MLSWLVRILPILALVTASCKIGSHANGEDKAKASDPDNYHYQCISALRSQIRKEFGASLQYLLMGSYFAQDNVNLNKISEMFFEHADEERQHGLM